MDKIREGILEALLVTHKPLWSVLSAVTSPGTGRVYSTADGVNLVRQCYALPKLRTRSFPMLEIKGLPDKGHTTFTVRFDELAYSPEFVVTMPVSHS